MARISKYLIWAALLIFLGLTIFRATFDLGQSRESSQARKSQTSEREVPPAEDSTLQPWPSLTGPNRDRSCSAQFAISVKGVVEPRIRWRLNVGEGYSSPVVSKEFVFVQYREGDFDLLEARNLQTGELEWTRSVPTTFVCQVAYSDGPYATPCLDQQRIVSLTADGLLICNAIADGAEFWRRDLKTDFEVEPYTFGYGPGLLMHEGRIFINVGGGKASSGIVALDSLDGSTIWQSTSDRWSYAPPNTIEFQGAICGVFLTRDHLRVLRLHDGTEVDSFELFSKIPDSINSVSPIVHGNQIFTVVGPGPGIRRTDLSSAGKLQLVWSDRRILDSQFNQIGRAHDGTIVGFTSARTTAEVLRGVDPEFGSVRWELDSKLGRGQILIAEDRLVCTGEYGDLLVCEFNDHELHVVYESDEPILDPPCYSAPAPFGNAIFWRNEKEIVAVEF